jgi:uncharacterized membrane protein (UPF0136 family)
LLALALLFLSLPRQLFCFRHEYKQTLFSLVLSSIVLLVRSRLSQQQQQQQLNLAAKRLLTVFFLIRYVLSFADRSLSLNAG